jgi:hypothetical protein
MRKTELFRLAVILFPLLFASCAPGLRRMGYDANPSGGRCHLKILTEDNSLDPAKKIGTLDVYDNGFSVGCSEQAVMDIVVHEGCGIGATVANLYNIQQPSVFGSTCFQTSVDFYSDATLAGAATQEGAATQAGAAPPVASRPAAQRVYQTGPVDTVRAKGLEIQFDLGVESVVSGQQNNLGLRPTPSVSKVLLGLGLIYMAEEKIGAEFDYEFYGATEANSEGYKPLSLFEDQLLRFGLVLSPYIGRLPRGLWRWNVKAGGNYDFLKLTSDYKTVIQNASPVQFNFYPGYAKGVGFYVKTDIEMVAQSGMALGIGMGYEKINPRFADATTGLDAGLFFFDVSLGYKFKWGDNPDKPEGE